MKRNGYILLSVVVVCCLASGVWYASVSGTVNHSSTPMGKDAVTRPVPTTLVAQPSIQKTRLFPGTVKARNNVELAFSVDGVLVELNAREGRLVKKGEVLARLDERDFRNAHDAAKASYLRSDADFRRAATLHKQSVISQSEYDTARTTVDVARAEFEIRKKAVEDTVIIAPYDGVIAKRYAENSEHVKKQTAILALKDISEIEIIIQIPELLMAQNGIHKFKDIKARFDVDDSQWFPCQVQEYSVQADPVTRTYAVALSLQSPGGLEVLPGMTATVMASLDTTLSEDLQSPVGLVPVESVFTGADEKNYIWLIPDDSGTPQKIAVTLGAMQGGNIEVMSGLQPGYRIATAGVHSLREEMQVRPMKTGGEGLDG